MTDTNKLTHRPTDKNSIQGKLAFGVACAYPNLSLPAASIGASPIFSKGEVK